MHFILRSIKMYLVELIQHVNYSNVNTYTCRERKLNQFVSVSVLSIKINTRHPGLRQVLVHLVSSAVFVWFYSGLAPNRDTCTCRTLDSALILPNSFCCRHPFTNQLVSHCDLVVVSLGVHEKQVRPGRPGLTTNSSAKDYLDFAICQEPSGPGLWIQRSWLIWLFSIGCKIRPCNHHENKISTVSLCLR